LRCSRRALIRRRHPLAAVHGPGERGVLGARHVAELAAAPFDPHRVRVVRVRRLADEVERVADGELLPDRRRFVIPEARERRALDQ
jgi:hypothetical protein